MQDELIGKIARLMHEQSAAYASLESLTGHLIGALTRCEPGNVESLTRAGEVELFRMRSRLLEMTSALTDFADLKLGQAESAPLSAELRSHFETSAKDLLANARRYGKISVRATSLALAGSTFAAANIQMCGVPPTTYNAPVLKQSRGATL